MPVVLRIKGYLFRFYSADLDEPPHVHVEKQGKHAKIWVDPVEVARPGRYRSHELMEIQRIVQENQDIILEVWSNEQNKRKNF
ncbi:MAG TPA: DUF4160 domain-containing protein [Caldilineae bacterium]|nr:DUF4160 domain-containing protein [Caldilineae bacterium]